MDEFILDIFAAYDHQQWEKLDQLIEDYQDKHKYCIAQMLDIPLKSEHKNLGTTTCRILEMTHFIQYMNYKEVKRKFDHIEGNIYENSSIPKWVKTIYYYAEIFLFLLFGVDLSNRESYLEKLKLLCKRFYASRIRNEVHKSGVNKESKLKYLKEATDIYLHLNLVKDYINTLINYYQLINSASKTEMIEHQSLEYAKYLAKKKNMNLELVKIYNAQGVVALGVKKFNLAERWLLKAYMLNIDKPYHKYIGYLFLAESYFYQGKIKAMFELLSEMENKFNKIPQLRRLQFRYHRLRSYFFVSKGNLKQAVFEMDEAIKVTHKYASDREYYNLLGEKYFIKILIGEYESVINSIETIEYSKLDLYSIKPLYFSYFYALLYSGELQKANSLMKNINPQDEMSFTKEEPYILNAVLARHNLEINKATEYIKKHKNSSNYEYFETFNLKAFNIPEIAYIALISRNIPSALDQLDLSYQKLKNLEKNNILFKVLSSFFEINYYLENPIDDIEEIYIDLDRYNVEFENNFIDFYYNFAKGLYHLSLDKTKQQNSAHYYFLNALSIKAPIEEHIKCVYYLLDTNEIKSSIRKYDLITEHEEQNNKIISLINNESENSESKLITILALVSKLKLEVLRDNKDTVRILYNKIIKLENETNYFGLHSTVNKLVSDCEIEMTIKEEPTT